jgi:hypothetical protein
LDETPDLDSIIEAIRDSKYFDNPDTIREVIGAAISHSQGKLLVTPFGYVWTTNGYLQCDHIQLDAAFGTQEQAAEALLQAIDAREEP